MEYGTHDRVYSHQIKTEALVTTSGNKLLSQLEQGTNLKKPEEEIIKIISWAH